MLVIQKHTQQIIQILPLLLLLFKVGIEMLPLRLFKCPKSLKMPIHLLVYLQSDYNISLTAFISKFEYCLHWFAILCCCSFIPICCFHFLSHSIQYFIPKISPCQLHDLRGIIIWLQNLVGIRIGVGVRVRVSSRVGNNVGISITIMMISKDARGWKSLNSGLLSASVSLLSVKRSIQISNLKSPCNFSYVFPVISLFKFVINFSAFVESVQITSL